MQILFVQEIFKMYSYMVTFLLYPASILRLGQTKLICCCSDSPVIFLVKRGKKGVKGWIQCACEALHAVRSAISGPDTHLSVRVRLSHSPDQDSFHSFKRDVCGALFAFK